VLNVFKDYEVNINICNLYNYTSLFIRNTDSTSTAPVSDESAFEVARPPAFGVHKNALYKSIALPYIFTDIQTKQNKKHRKSM